LAYLDIAEHKDTCFDELITLLKVVTELPFHLPLTCFTTVAFVGLHTASRDIGRYSEPVDSSG